jgi:undecaprenyl diphosphate synthase
MNQPILQHLALIMDGNRRWAKQRGKLPWEGHSQGAQKVELVLRFCLENKIPHVSLYALSLENLKREAQEVSYIFHLMVEYAVSQAHHLLENNIKVRFLGDVSLLPENVREQCKTLEKKTEHCTALTCNFLICYGGQQEIVQAAWNARHELSLTVENFSNYLWTRGQPFPDLIIRTGNVQRLSNFLLFQAAYAEIRFSKTLWPDISEQELEQLLNDYQATQKNFGR